MKVGRMFVMLAVALAVLGAGLSYSGYNESQTTVTLTNVRSYSTTLTEVSATMMTETTVLSTSTHTTWQDAFSIDPGAGVGYCGMIMTYEFGVLDAGQVHVSFTSNGKVDFFMLNQHQYNGFKSLKTCKSVGQYTAVTAKRGNVDSYESTVDIPSTDSYYFVFLSENRYFVHVKLNVDRELAVETTETIVHTSYSTGVIPLLTKAESVEIRPAGLGLLFYGGVGLIAAAAVALAISRTRAAVRKTAPPAALPTVAPVGAPTSQQSAGKFCVNCGAPLPSHATFCNKCGSKETLVEPTAKPQPSVKGRQVADVVKPTKFCRKCGAKIRRDSTYCEECGARLA